jgi:hypothetical protein
METTSKETYSPKPFREWSNLLKHKMTLYTLDLKWSITHNRDTWGITTFWAVEEILPASNSAES